MSKRKSVSVRLEELGVCLRVQKCGPMYRVLLNGESLLDTFDKAEAYSYMRSVRKKALQ